MFSFAFPLRLESWMTSFGTILRCSMGGGRTAGRLVAAGLALVVLMQVHPPAEAQRGDENLTVNARLLFAARNADGGEIARALKDGAAIDSRNRLGETPLIIVLKKGRADLARVLIDAGANVSQPALNGITPLMAAAYEGDVEIVRTLLAKGVDVHAVDRLKKNAIIYAAGEGRTDIVKLLLAHGVDPNAAYHNDLTALMWAAGYGHAGTVKVLLEAGARAELKDNRGKTALDMAREQKQEDTVRLLEAVLPLSPEQRQGAELKTLAILDFALVDDQRELSPATVEYQRLSAIRDQLQEEIARKRLYRVVDPAPAAELIQKYQSATQLHECNGCELEIARSLRADRVLVGWVQKVSNLILNINIQIEDVVTGAVVLNKSVDLRGNTDETWRRGVSHLVSSMVEKGQGNR